MRVIAGTARGTRLSCPRGRATRPATDRLRTSLFSILQDTLGGARVLDLYAGSGSLGIEAVSRGAASCTFVESAPDAVAALRGNLERTRLGARARVVQADVGEALDRFKAERESFDVVFVDPPFSCIEEGIRALGATAEVCVDGAVVFFRTETSSRLVEPPQGLRLFRERSWGRSLGLFMLRADGEDHR